MSATIPPIILLFMMVLAGIGDFMTFRIPNWLSAAVALAFIPMAMWTGMPWEAIGMHAAAGFALLVLGFALFAAGAFGGGDAKLMAAAALWFGYPDTVSFLAYTILAGGVLGVAISCWNVIHIDLEVRGKDWLRRLIDYKPDIPYGLAFAAGAVMALPGSWWLPAAAS
jgi:prepilin peptidase CpaA